MAKTEKPKISSPKTLPRWRITISRKRAQELGEVDAADEGSAIRQAARAFEVRDADIPGLAAAQRVWSQRFRVRLQTAARGGWNSSIFAG
jgi:hypothetical protein